jgi:adenosylcobinamide-phosphate synthase
MFLTTFDLNPAMQAILIVWLSIAIERIVAIAPSIDPLTFFRFVCERMAQRVLKAHYKGQQAYISGGLALIVLIGPVVIISYLIREFASYQWLIDILLLWVLLQYNQHVKSITKSTQALTQNKKQLAKSLLQPSVLRQTDSLSAMGIAKASIECLFLRYNHQYCTVIFWYLIAGPIAALVYRLCYEANQIWSPKLSGFAVFGKCAQITTRFFQFIPSILTSASFMLLTHPSKAFAYFVNKPFWISAVLKQRQMLLQSLAVGLQVDASGPLPATYWSK